MHLSWRIQATNFSGYIFPLDWNFEGSLVGIAVPASQILVEENSMTGSVGLFWEKLCPRAVYD